MNIMTRPNYYHSGLASIIVGAAMLGLAVALARIEKPGNNFFTWLFLVACPVLVVIGATAFYEDRHKSLGNRIGLYACGFGVIFVLLIWVGVGAGIK
jgi:succinate dehydrogenase hydrophobic anchor subunit